MRLNRFMRNCPAGTQKPQASRNTINCQKTCSTIWPASRNWWRLLHRSSPPVPNGRIRLCFNPTDSGSHESDPKPGFSGSALFGLLCRLPGVGHGCFTGLVGQHRIFRIHPGKWVRSLGLGSGPGTWRSGGAGVGPGQRRGIPMIF